MKQQESAVSGVIVFVGIILVVLYPYLIKIKDYFSQKFHEISTAVNNFISYINTHGITVVLLCLFGLLVICLIYRIIKDIKTKIKGKKEETTNLKHEAKEIEKILDKKLDFDYKEILNFIEQIENKIKVSKESKKLSRYYVPLKDKLEKAKEFLECEEYEEYVNSLSQKEKEASNNLKKLRQEQVKVEQYLLKGKQQIQENPEENSEKPQTENGFIDVHKGFFKHSNLKLDEVKYLINQGYKEYRFKSINENAEELYLLKPGHNESSQHFFLICDIVECIKEYTDKIETFNTEKPDIVFEINNQKYAIEVETGKVIKNKKKFLEKVKTLKKDYGENWFFVLTDRNLFKDYSKFGETYTKKSIVNKITRLSQNVTTVPNPNT